MRIEMPEKRKKYDREFREGAVRIVEEANKPIAQVARDLGVNEGTLGNWVQRARAPREGQGELSKDDYRLGLRVLQPPTPAQRGWHDVTGQLRAVHRSARPGRRVARSPPRSGGNRTRVPEGPATSRA